MAIEAGNTEMDDTLGEGLDYIGSTDIYTKTFKTEDLKGKEIRFAITNYPPFLKIEKSVFGFSIKNVSATGQAWELLESLRRFFDFNPIIVKSNLSVIGYQSTEGKWDGIIGLLNNNDADVTLLPVTLTSLREKDIDFSVPLSTSSYGILVKRPANSSNPDALLKPFTLEVWLWILGSLILMGPLIYMITRTRVRLCKGNKKLTKFFPLDQCVWFVFGALMKQGSTLEPVTDSSRILFATWWIYTVIVTAFYTANLTAFLTFNGFRLFIHDVSSLEGYPQLKWVAAYDDALINIIKTDNTTKILRNMEKEGRGSFIHSKTKALNLVRNGTHVYIDDMRVLNYLIYDDFIKGRKNLGIDRCDFYTTPLNPPPPYGGKDKLRFYWGFGYSKNSSLKGYFDPVFRRLNACGVIGFLEQNYTGGKVCDLPKGFKERPLQNRDLITTYFMALFGSVFSCLIFFLEYVYGRTRKRKETSKKLKPSGFSFIKPDKNSFLPFSVFPDQFVPFSHNFAVLPRKAPKRKLFHVKYPKFGEKPNFHEFPSYLGNNGNERSKKTERQREENREA